jgi:hypothetical protein
MLNTGAGNYGLYFNAWNRFMDTNHPDYETLYREVSDGSGLVHQPPASWTFNKEGRKAGN